MRVAFFTDTYLPNVDGVVTSMLNFRRELERRGDDVFVFSAGDAAARKNNRDSKVFFYRSIRFPLYPQYKIALFPYTSARKVKKLGVDVVHCHALASMGFAAIAAAKYSRSPLVGTFHTLLPLATSYIVKQRLANHLLTQAAWRAVRMFYKPFNLVTAPSKVIQQMLADNGVDSVVLPNGVDVDRFASVDARAFKARLCGDKKMVLCAGRLGFEKNVDVVLKAFARQDEDALLVVTGNGPARKKCERLALDLRLSDKVKFTGFVPSGDLPLYYNAADCFATASTFETQGLALLEAMACGSVCVGADALAVPEAIRDKRNGFLFTPFDVADCAEKMGEALRLSARRRKAIASNARKTALKYSIPKVTLQLSKLYSKLL